MERNSRTPKYETNVVGVWIGSALRHQTYALSRQIEETGFAAVVMGGN